VLYSVLEPGHADIQIGDKILEVNGAPVQDQNIEEVIDRGISLK